MKISTKGEYGIRAMLFIGMYDQAGPVPSHEIAERQGIPAPYLRQILALLSKDRLIQSVRGPQGGHILARPAREISFKDILMTLEGQTTSIDHILALPCTIDIGTRFCAIREVFLEVKEAVEGILSTTTLADLIERQETILEKRTPVPLDTCEEGALPILVE